MSEKWKRDLDAWITREEPDYYEPEDGEDECNHEDYDVDILTGRATCPRCEFWWWEPPVARERALSRLKACWQCSRGGRWLGWARWWLRTSKLGYRYKQWKFDRECSLDDEVPF